MSKILAFSFSFIGVFLMVALPHLGITTDGLINPTPNGIDRFDSIKPRLEQIKNDYHLKKGLTLIESAQASEMDQIKSYVAVDNQTGQVLVEKDLSKRLPIASLTKIMTAIVALDLASPQEIITVSKDAPTVIPSKVFLKEGERLTVEELLNCFLLSSANDCAESIKDGIDAKYQSSVFIKAMNAKASFLELKNTHFINPEGFDSDDHFSSVEDLAILSNYALKNYPLFAQIVSKESEDLPQTNTHKHYYLNNWNGLLGVYPGVKGLKIGNTDQAGNTTVILSERQGKQVLVVLLGAPGVLERDLWASELLDKAFNKAFNFAPVNITEDQLRAKYASWKYL